MFANVGYVCDVKNIMKVRFALFAAIWLCLLAATCHAILPFDSNVDLLGFQRNPITDQFSYRLGASRVRLQWAGASFQGPTQILFQGAARRPVLFYVFKQVNGMSITDVYQGKVSPTWIFATHVQTPKGKWVPGAVDSVSQYLTIPDPGYYFFVAQEVSASATPTECTLAVRSVTLNTSPAEQARWRLADVAYLKAMALEDEAALSQGFRISNEKEKYLLRGVVCDSPGGQTVELLFRAQTLLWQAKKPYGATGIMTQLASRGFLPGGTGSEWNLLLRNYKLTSGSTSGQPPVVCSFVFERWVLK